MTTVVAANTNNIASLVRAFISWTSFVGFLNRSQEEQYWSDPQQVEQGEEEADQKKSASKVMYDSWRL
jgi:hypothetical protein